uniref:Uncharacterized protein n=1 Tax=Rhizophora mucronata TaxID=61149 RepID=A0A2P2PJE4_RHIMU
MSFHFSAEASSPKTKGLSVSHIVIN